MYSILYSIEKIIIIHILRVLFWDKTRLAVFLALNLLRSELFILWYSIYAYFAGLSYISSLLSIFLLYLATNNKILS